MIRAVIYEVSSGNIRSCFKGAERNLSLNVPEGHDYLISEEDVENKIVVDGVLTSLPSEVIEQKEIGRSWHNLRKERDYLLSECDWTQVPDVPVDSAAWATYRQQLRDLPANTTDPRDVVWPEPPS